ncbi:DtxR family transcriptional regulator [Halobacteriales archaeon SW_5_70_135]|nr:MAG: DtxR family transcriptional regulator [Halobacteriales archaeon SW_5_70_135]
MLSDAMEDYLKAVYVLQVETGPPVATSAIAEYLDVTAPTVSSMLADLEQRGLLDREKYEGVELTDEGETVALEVLRHHRLIEAYLAERLDYDWSEVHDEADRLEHHISEEFERRVADVLDDPDVDPHGDPIPSADLSPPDTRPGTRMDDLIEGDRAAVDRVHNADDEVLDYLENAGLTPDTRLAVEEVAPFGMVTVRPAGADADADADTDTDSVSLPERVARAVEVRRTDDPDEEPRVEQT